MRVAHTLVQEHFYLRIRAKASLHFFDLEPCPWPRPKPRQKTRPPLGFSPGTRNGEEDIQPLGSCGSLGAAAAMPPLVCLLIHGCGGSPFEMEGIAAALETAGVRVQNLCLPGHGEDSARFYTCRFGDWLHHAEQAVTDLASEGNRVALVGFSMGGSLALHMAARLPVVGVAALSTPAYILNLLPRPFSQGMFYARSLALKIKRMVERYFPATASGETSRDIAPGKGYDGPASLAQLMSFRSGCSALRRLLPQVTVPLLVMHDAGDMLVPCHNAWTIAEKAGSAVVTLTVTRIRETTTRHHMIPTHRETASLVAESVTRFVTALRAEALPGLPGKKPGPAAGFRL